MQSSEKHYIDGRWTTSSGGRTIEVVDPAIETAVGKVTLGTAKDVDRAVAAARRAFEAFSVTSIAERLELLDRIVAAYETRIPDLAKAVTTEIGAPSWLAEQMQATLGLVHLSAAREILQSYEFTETSGGTRVVKEPIGVCALITPWNWPLNQIACKVAPALAVGCTIVLKPSEIAPFSADIFAEIMDAAGVPAGVFNLVHGDGAVVGAALSSHHDVDMVSFTGSTRAGIEVARSAAATVKRVHQELGGKSPNIILRSASLKDAVSHGVASLLLNSGQSCNAPTRMLVPTERMAEAAEIARAAMEEHTVGPPNSNARIGPVASKTQWEKIQGLIERAIEAGATLVTGGPGRPPGLDVGFYVKPTIFADLTNEHEIAREEVFGPVLAILGYEEESDAIRIANDTPYGLAAYVHGAHHAAQDVAAKLRAGQVVLNQAELDFGAPFGGYKQSGNGREWGKHAFADFLEIKAIVGDRVSTAASR